MVLQEYQSNFTLSSNQKQTDRQVLRSRVVQSEPERRQSRAIMPVLCPDRSRFDLFQTGARWRKWLECEFTDRKVRGSNPTSAYRLPLSGVEQLGSIPALVLASGDMVVRHLSGATSERTNECVRGLNSTSASRLPLSRVGQPGSIPALVLSSCSMAARYRKGATAETKLAPNHPDYVEAQRQFQEAFESSHDAMANFLESDAEHIEMLSNFVSAQMSYFQDAQRVLSDLQTRLQSKSVVRTRPLPFDFPCQGLGNLVVSQSSYFLQVAWQLGTGRMLQLDDLSDPVKR
ncbi:hypothetical protein T265_13410, partial [Opisthorchis viverrini]